VIRIILLFLAVVAVLGLFGVFGRGRRGIGRRDKSGELAKPRICPQCARVNVGTDRCDCEGR